MGRVLKQNDNWAHFNGTSSLIRNGSTSTLGWMNDGVFRMEFDIIAKSVPSVGDRPIATAINNATRGFMIYCSGSDYRIYWCNGSGTSYGCAIAICPATTIGEIYHIIIEGDGTKLYTTSLDSNGNIVVARSGVFCTYISNPTTSYPLTFSLSTYKANVLLKNFKIWKDQEGTEPFLHMPLQDENNISYDLVGGLTGTVTDVSIVDRNNKVLKSNDDWMYFNGETAQIVGGDTSTLGWMNAGTFSMDLDIIRGEYDNATIAIYTGGGPAARGFMFGYTSGSNAVVYWSNGNSSAYARKLYGVALVIGTKYRLTLKGNGTQLRYIQTNLETNTLHYDSGWVACTFVPYATTSQSIRIAVGNGFWAGYQRDFKVYRDTESTDLFLHAPLKDYATVDLTGNVALTHYNTEVQDLNNKILKK